LPHAKYAKIVPEVSRTFFQPKSGGFTCPFAAGIALSAMVLRTRPSRVAMAPVFASPALDDAGPHLWHEDRMDVNAMSQNASHSSKKATTMQTAIATNQVGKFPVIQFRKKRLTVAIHAHFDMQNADEVNEVKRLVEQALAQLAEDGDVKVSYTLSDV